MKKIKAKYNLSVFKPQIESFRSVEVLAILELISEKRARIISCSIYNKNTSKRQSFYAKPYEENEVGKIKNISSLYEIEEIA